MAETRKRMGSYRSTNVGRGVDSKSGVCVRGRTRGSHDVDIVGGSSGQAPIDRERSSGKRERCGVIQRGYAYV